MTHRWTVRRTKVVAAALTALPLCFCLNLDSFLFKGKEIDTYLFDQYDGPVKAECADALDSIKPVAPTSIHEFTVASGSEIIAAVLLADTMEFAPDDTVILYIHGTSLHMDYYWPRTRLLAATGYPVFTFDYRGYGKSSGKPTEAGIYEDGSSVLRYIEQCGNPRVIVYAYSLGSLVGCELASKNSTGAVVGLILEAPIGSIETLVQDAAYIDMPGSWIVTMSGRNVDKIKEVKMPLLWLHGTDDQTLPIETNGKPVYRNYAGVAGYYAIVENAGHRTVPSTIGYARYQANIVSFITGRAGANPDFSVELP